MEVACLEECRMDNRRGNIKLLKYSTGYEGGILSRLAAGKVFWRHHEPAVENSRSVFLCRLWLGWIKIISQYASYATLGTVY